MDKALNIYRLGGRPARIEPVMVKRAYRKVRGQDAWTDNTNGRAFPGVRLVYLDTGVEDVMALKDYKSLVAKLGVETIPVGKLHLVVDK